MAAVIACQGVHITPSTYPPGSVIVVDATGRMLLSITNEPETAQFCYEQLAKKMHRCACSRPFFRNGGPRKRCLACAKKAKREGHVRRNRRYRKKLRKQSEQP